MTALIVTLAAMVLIGWLGDHLVHARQIRSQSNATSLNEPAPSFFRSLRRELRALGVVFLAIFGIFLLLLLFTMIFGPIAQIHEWGR